MAPIVAPDLRLRASRVIVTSFGPVPALSVYRTSGFELRPVASSARSTWSEADVYTLVPIAELPFTPSGWDLVVTEGVTNGPRVRADSLRPTWLEALRAWDYSTIFLDDLREGGGT